MGKRILIVGGVAGGASTAARARRLDENAEIIIFERGPHVSFSNCALPYYLSGVVESEEDLLMMGIEQFYNEYRIEARVNSEVISIDRENKEIRVKNLEKDEEYTEKYDKLVLSPGASPIVPNIKGIDKAKIFTVRNVVDIGKLHDYIQDKKKITVVGGGFIGLEVAENLQLAEKDFEVSLVEAMDQVMCASFDYDMVQILHREIYDNGINLIVNDKVVEFTENSVILESGKEIETDAVVMAIGVRPETKLAVDSGLEIGEYGGIVVDHNHLTNDKDIYAVGDAIEVYYKLAEQKGRLALAGPAQRQARAVADHINGIPTRQRGYIGSSVIKVFDYNAASTGLTERDIKQFNLSLDYDWAMVIPSDMVGLMPDANPMFFKLLFEVPTGRVLGAQAIGKGNVDKRIDVIATVINFNGTIDDIIDLELTYAPPFGTVKDVTIYAALSASNILNKVYKQVSMADARRLVEEGAYILDVRNTFEYENGHILGSVNIPLCELRDRIDEIPKDKTVYVHCRSAQRSYNAAKALQQRGFKDVYNIAGSFLGISMYEYYNDVVLERKPIVDKYNFN